MAEQGLHPVADEVDGGLVAGDVEQDDLVPQLGGGQHVAVLLGLDQAGEDVVGGMGPLPGDDLVEVGGHGVAGLEGGAACPPR